MAYGGLLWSTSPLHFFPITLVTTFYYFPEYKFIPTSGHWQMLFVLEDLLTRPS